MGKDKIDNKVLQPGKSMVALVWSCNDIIALATGLCPGVAWRLLLPGYYTAGK